MTADPTELLMRGAAAGLFLFVTLSIFSSHWPVPRRPHWSAIFLNIGLVCYLLLSSPATEASFIAIRPVLVLMAALNPVFLAWATLEVFDDEFRPRIWHGAVAAVILVGSVLASRYPVAGQIRLAVVAVVYAGLLFVIARTAASDLINARRRFRTVLFVVAAMTGLIVTAVEAGFRPAGDLVLLRLQAGSFMAIGLSFAIWYARLSGDIWFSSVKNATYVSEAEPADEAVRVRLDALMAEGVWREEGLTISRLSGRLQTQEHRLRRVINRGLGYRNFNAFLNSARIAEAQRLLSDPGLADRRIIQIAYDLGFASLGPFNRAFRDQTGENPTEFRKRTLARRADS